MKSLIVLVSLLAVTLGSLSNGNVRVPMAPAVRTPIRGGQYRVETASADGSVAGQYGYQTEGQHVQVSYSAAAKLARDANTDQTYASGTTADDTSTITGLKTEGTLNAEETPKTLVTPKAKDAEITTPLVSALPLSFIAPLPQTYGAYYPTAQVPSYYYNVKPVPSGNSQIGPQVPVTGPNNVNYYQNANPQPIYYFVPISSHVQPSQIIPQVGTVPVTVTAGHPTFGSPVFTGESGSTPYTGQVLTEPVGTPTVSQVYSDKPTTSGLTPVAQISQSATSGAYSTRYGHVKPNFSHRSYYPAYTYPGYAQRHGYLRFQ